MTYEINKMLKLILSSTFLILTLTSCTAINNTKTVINELAHKSPSNHKTITGSNDFQSLIDSLVTKSINRLKKHITSEDVVLVSDFVNLDRLKNRSNLGFLLADHLKNTLLNNDIIVRQVELGRDFQYGESGFNLLTREVGSINKKYVDNANFAFVGTYTVTTQNLIVFVKLIDIHTGNILSSANAKTSVDDEIVELEGYESYVRPPMVL